MNNLTLRNNPRKDPSCQKKSQYKTTNHTTGKAVVLIVLFFMPCFYLNAATTETVDSLVNENRVLSTPYELHITTIDTPFVNSTVDLTHTDAWVFLENIRPDIFLSKHKNSVSVNGEQLVNGVNGRVAIYAHGTVVIPHNSSFKPLTVYTEEDFRGDSLQLELHTYHNSLDSFNNKIKSFKLKRGYMATLATNADGSDYSRVFIADKEDLQYSTMPDNLYSNVSFIRVFKHQWVTKKGWCGWNADEVTLSNVTCYYDWDAGGTTTSNYEYSPIRQNGGWPSWTTINNKQNVSHLLGFNEPDHTDQSNLSFDEMLEIWPGMLNSGLRLGSPAWANPYWTANSSGLLFDFIDACEEQNYRVDFIALHCYWGGKTPINWYNDLKYVHDQTGRPLWITEWNNGANWTTESWPDDTDELTPDNAQKQLDDLKGILEVLDTAHFVERYFIYNWVEDRRAIILDDTLTPAGEYYAASKSQIAYNSINDVVPGWNYSDPELSYRYLRLADAIRLEWENPNGDMCRTFTIEKSVNGGTYDEIYSGSDMSELYYIDYLDMESVGTNTYRINFENIEGDILTTNEVSFYLTEGSNFLQTGNFIVGDADWNTTLFSKEYSDDPVVLLGVPSYNNAFPFTNRVDNASENYFIFHVEPWDYLDDPEFTKKDLISALTLPAGIYNLGSVKAEANIADTIDRNWKYISFNAAFSESPAIFATVVSNSTPYPITTAIQNVTTSGFELSLKTEEDITSLIMDEQVSYLAIEPGSGAIDGKRFTVGNTLSGSGISTSPKNVTIDSTYIDPVLFGNLLSANDNFASTLRYSKTSETNFKITKQRESSATVVATQSDHIGWMIMDFASDQSDYVEISTIGTDNEITIYPNPVEDILYIISEKDIDASIKVYDLLGHNWINTKASKQLTVSNLPSGIYYLVIDDNATIKFIKK